MDQLSISDNAQRVVPIKVGVHQYYSKFKSLHLKNPGTDQLQKDLYRYRTTQEIAIELFDVSQNYTAPDKQLHAKLT